MSFRVEVETTRKVVALWSWGHEFDLQKQALVQNVRWRCVHQIAKWSDLSPNPVQTQKSNVPKTPYLIMSLMYMMNKKYVKWKLKYPY